MEPRHNEPVVSPRYSDNFFTPEIVKYMKTKARYNETRVILCFHYNAIKNKNRNHLMQKVQNLESERR